MADKSDIVVETCMDPCPLCDTRLIGFSKEDMIEHFRDDGAENPEMMFKLQMEKKSVEERNDE